MSIGKNLLLAMAPNLFSIIDQAVPDKDLQAKLKSELSVKLLEANDSMVTAAASVITAETQGSSWLQRSWRPLTMVWFVVLLSIYWFGFIPVAMPAEHIDMILNLITFGMSGYVVGRSAEKVAESVGSAISAPRTHSGVP